MRPKLYILLLPFLVACQSGTNKKDTGTITSHTNNEDTVVHKAPVFSAQPLIEMISAHYKEQFKKGTRLETEQTDSTTILTFYNIPTKDDSYDGFLMTVNIPKREKDFLIGDVNKDGINDVVADIWTEGGGGGGNSAWNDLFTFLSGNDTLSLVNVIQSTEVCGCKTGTYGGSFHPEKIEAGVISGTSTCWAEDDPHCCPSEEYSTTVRLVNNKLVMEGTKFSKKVNR